MKKQSLVSIVILMLIFSVLISCSKDKPTENESNLSPSNLIVGSWELTTVKVNGVVSTPQTDPIFRFYEDEAIIIFRADGTGLYSNDQKTVEFTNWYTEGGELIVSSVENGLEKTLYSLQGNTFTIFHPRDDADPPNVPDLEYIYTRM